MNDLSMRQARPEDVESLVTAFDDRHFVCDRLDRQQRGLGVLLTAWLHDFPVGMVYLWLEEADETEIRQHLPNVPLLNHLVVVPACRNLGIGSQLVAEAERILAKLKHDRVALAVRTDNKDAARLYKRLGYVPVEVDKEEMIVECLAEIPLGNEVRLEVERCYVRIKDLTGSWSGEPRMLEAAPSH